MALTEVYVDPSIAADSGTGTIGDPYGDLEYAIEQTTFDTTNGTRVNIKAGTAEVLAANLETALADTVTTVAWVPGPSAPLVFQGYSSVAGDGGIGEISGGGSVPILDATSRDYINFRDLKMGDVGANQIIHIDAYSSVIGCELWGSSMSGYCLQSTSYGMMKDCYIHSITATNGIYWSTGIVENCYFDWTGMASGYGVVSNGSRVVGNIVLVDNAVYGIRSTVWIDCRNNSVYHVGGDGTGIGISCASNAAIVENNLVEGFAGAGGIGIDINSVNYINTSFRGNAVYNCTTDYDADVALNWMAEDNETLTASPFNDAANGDFSPVDTGNVLEGSLPQIIGMP